MVAEGRADSWRAVLCAATLLPVVAALGASCGGVQSAPAADAGPDVATILRDATAPDAPATDAADAADGGADAVVHPDDASPDAAPDAPPDVVCGPPPAAYEAGAPMTVAGTVLGQNNGPLYGTATVTIEGQTATTTASGAFSLAGITPPYDLLISYTGTEVAYLGLTRSDPTLVLPTAYDSTNVTSEASLWVTVTRDGGAWVPGPSQFGFTGLQVDEPSPDSVVSGEVAAGGPTGLTAQWGGAPTTSATLWAFGGTSLPTGGPASFDAVGSKPMTLDAGQGEQTPDDVSLGIAPGTFTPTSLSGTLGVPAACAAPSVEVSMDGWSIFMDKPAADAGSFRYGTLAGPFTWSVIAQCAVPSGTCSVTRSALTGDETLPITLPTPQTFLTTPPADGEVLAACPDFAWTPTPDSAYLVTLGPLSGTNVTYLVVTTGTSFRAPFPFPSGPWIWSVSQLAGYASADDVTASFASANDILPYGETNQSGCSTPGHFTVP